MILLHEVVKRYDDITVLGPIDLELKSGQTTVLIGPSGCGKSTLLRLVNGLVSPDQGIVRVFDRDVSPRNIQSLRLNMGYVIQDGGLFPHLTAHDNITIMAQHLKRPAETIAARVDMLCSLTKFPGALIERYPAELSGGQRQRVSLMRALMLDPDLLLLDEPLGALDPMIRAELQTDLKRVFAELKKTVILVTHELNEAAYFADQVVLMHDGEIVQHTPPRELFQHPASGFVERFVNAQRAIRESIGP